MAAVVKRELVPATAAPVPERMTRVNQSMVNGLPQTIDLDAELSLIVAVPSGMAIEWRDADPTAEVTRSEMELQASRRESDAPVGVIDRPPARVLLRSKGEIVASTPLVGASRRMLPEEGDEDRGARIELLLLGWDIRAGSMKGPGDFGSHIEFAWRRADRGSERFSPPPINPRAIARLGPEFRMRSHLVAGSADDPNPETEV